MTPRKKPAAKKIAPLQLPRAEEAHLSAEPGPSFERERVHTLENYPITGECPGMGPYTGELWLKVDLATARLNNGSPLRYWVMLRQPQEPKTLWLTEAGLKALEGELAVVAQFAPRPSIQETLEAQFGQGAPYSSELRRLR